MTRKSTSRPSNPATRGRPSRFNQARIRQRAARRLASRSALVSVWWDALSYPRPESFTPLALRIAFGGPSNRFSAALRWLGWTHTVRRVHGSKATLWLPPASTVKPRPVGRPRIYAD
jgi:hypothetical protein